MTTTRPFALTLQTHQLDLHRLWLVLLGLASLLLAAWSAWAVTDQFVVYESSSHVELTGRITREQTVDQQGNAYQLRSIRQIWLEASFPLSVRGRLQAGQSASVFSSEVTSAQLTSALVTSVTEDAEQGMIRVMLRADAPEDGADPFAGAAPSRVQVEVGKVSPISLLLFNRATPKGRPSRE